MFDLWDRSAAIKRFAFTTKVGNINMKIQYLELEEQQTSRRQKELYCFPGCEMSYIQIPFVLSCSVPNLPLSSFPHKIGPRECTVSLMGDLTNWVSSFLWLVLCYHWALLTKFHDGLYNRCSLFDQLFPSFQIQSLNSALSKRYPFQISFLHKRDNLQRTPSHPFHRLLSHCCRCTDQTRTPSAVFMTAPTGKGQPLIGAQCDRLIKEEDDLRCG